MDKLVVTAKKELLERKKKIKAKTNEFIGTSKSSLSISVTPKMIPRAIKFMDILIKNLKKNGYKIGFKEYYGTVVIVDSIEFSIRLREKCRRIKKDDNIWTTSELEPIGKLIFTVDTFPRKEWEDSDKKLIDLKITNIIDYLEQKAREEVKFKIERENRDKELSIQRRVDHEQKLLQEKEQEKYNDLLEASERWHQANRLREFIDTIKVDNSNDRFSSSLEKESWLFWAYKKADEIDPIVNI